MNRPNPEIRESGIRIRMTYLVTLQTITGKEREEMFFPPGSTLRDVARRLESRYCLSIPSEDIVTYLNGREWSLHPDKWSTEIREDDEICLFPPMLGG